MAFRFKSMGYKMKPSSLSPLRQTEDFEDGMVNKYNKKTTATNEVVKDIVGAESSVKKTDNVATSDSEQYNPTTIKKNEDPKTGYYNPFETLAKAILTPDTERAKQRVKERQEKRLEKVSKTGNDKKIERVKARQSDVRKQRGFDK